MACTSGVLLAGLGAAAAAGRPAPDLAVRALADVEGSYLAGAQIVVRETVVNAGRRRARPSLTRFYLSRDRRKSRDDLRLLGARRTPMLLPRRRSRGRTTLTVPALTALGLYYVLACADDRRAVRERRERNNCRSSRRQLEIAQGPGPEPRPDVRPDSGTGAGAGGGGPLPGSPGDPANANVPDLAFPPADPADFTVVDGVPLSRRTFLLVFRDSATVADANALLTSVDATIIGAISDAALLYLRLPDMPVAGTFRLLETLRADARVRAVVNDAGGLRAQRLAPHNITPNLWTWETGPPTSGNWGLELIRAPQLWNLDTFVRRSAPRDICVGALDPSAGPDAKHPELEFDPDTPEGNDDHPTGVAGVLGATWDDGEGVEGVDPWLTAIYARGHAPYVTAIEFALFDQTLPNACVKAVNMTDGWHAIPPDPREPANLDEWGDHLHVVVSKWAAANRDDFFLVASAGNGGAAKNARENSMQANAAARGLHPRYLSVESIGWNNAPAAHSDDGGSVAAPGLCVRTTESGTPPERDADDVDGDMVADCLDREPFPPSGWGDWWDGPGGAPVDSLRSTRTGTSFAAAYVTGLITALWRLEPALSVAEIRTLITDAVYTGGHAEPRIDAYAAAMGIDGLRGNTRLQRALVDIDDGSSDGALRMDPTTGEPVAGNLTDDRLPGDGAVSMRDFRAWRDAYLQTHADDFGAAGVPGVALDGGPAHFKKDLNLDGCVAGRLTSPPHPAAVGIPAPRDGDCGDAPAESVFPRQDFNGDGLLAHWNTPAPFKIDPDTACVAPTGPPGCPRDIDVLADPELWLADEQVFAEPAEEGACGDCTADRWTPHRYLLGNRDDAANAIPLNDLPDYLHSFDLRIRFDWPKINADYEAVVIDLETEPPAASGAPPFRRSRTFARPTDGRPTAATVTLPLWTGRATVTWKGVDVEPPLDRNEQAGQREWTDVAFGEERRVTIPAEESCDQQVATIVGTAGDDTLVGTDGPDVIAGLGGADTISGLEGDDSLCGESDGLREGLGNDTLLGGDGDDRLLGGGADDSLHGEAGNDNLKGDANSDVAGKDTLIGGSGDDELYGDLNSPGNADDELYGGTGNDHLVGDGGFFGDPLGLPGDDIIDGGPGVDTASYWFREHDLVLSLDGLANDGQPGAEIDNLLAIENVVGGHGNNTITGDDTANHLDVTSGRNNTLFGRGGDDMLFGGLARDTLNGGAGSDILHGDWEDDDLDGRDGVFGNDALWGGPGTDECRADVSETERDRVEECE